jgi:hypothetical protein
VKPSDITLRKHFNPLMGAFGNLETEVQAAQLVAACQRRNEEWKAFTVHELHDALGCEKGEECPDRNHIALYRLTTDGWLVIDDDKVFFTKEFVSKCYEAA